MKHNFEKLFNLSSKVVMVIGAVSIIFNGITKFLTDTGVVRTIFPNASDMCTQGTGSNIVVECGGLA